MDEIAKTVVSGLSALILAESRRLAGEWRYPTLSGGEMDDFIKESKEKLRRLRELREWFEAAFTGAPI